MRAAVRAADLGADHAEGLVLDELHGLGVDRLVERGPAAAGVELRAALEELLAARRTRVDAGALLVEQLTGPRTLGPGLPEHGVLVRGELLAPLGVGLVDVVRHCFLLLPVEARWWCPTPSVNSPRCPSIPCATPAGPA
ncbi:hypothetical protein Cus16_2922 [Curtobacterium sp. ER1/6]|nr:hypothetical protein Cus16_2922 [Curtobacterium sp. ER1/6]